MAREQLLKKIDEVANLWNKTKDQYYKFLWYKLIKECNNRHGAHNTERWNISVSSVNKGDDGTYVIIGKRIRPL